MTGPRQLFVNSIAHLKVGVKNFRELIFLFGGKTQSAQEVTDPRQLFINSIEYPKLGVKNFRGLVFLCGGKIDEAAGKPQSARDVYYRYVKNNDTELFDDVVIADFIMEWNENGIYGDLISFEKSLASLSGAIVVFVESYGSVAELGSFVMIPELTKKLIVVPQGRHFNVETAKQGFVVRGPIHSLRMRLMRTPNKVLKRKTTMSQSSCSIGTLMT